MILELTATVSSATNYHEIATAKVIVNIGSSETSRQTSTDRQSLLVSMMLCYSGTAMVIL